MKLKPLSQLKRKPKKLSQVITKSRWCQGVPARLDDNIGTFDDRDIISLGCKFCLQGGLIWLHKGQVNEYEKSMRKLAQIINPNFHPFELSAEDTIINFNDEEDRTYEEIAEVIRKFENTKRLSIS